MSKYSARSGGFYRLWAQVKREEPTCWLCGRLIDPALKYPDPMSFSVDHVQLASTHPWLAKERSNMRGSHLDCNRKRGNRNPSTVQSTNYSGTDL